MPANPHDERLELCWKICRYGLDRVARDDPSRARVLAWIERMRVEHPDVPYLAGWADLVRAAPGGLPPDLATAAFSALPEDRRAHWRPLVQSQPFACILPGRTTHERRAFLARMP